MANKRDQFVEENGSRFEVLEGLPVYGPEAEPFSATGMGTHSEGFVVRFRPANSEPWIGNFQPGLSSFCTVEEHPNGRHLIVISGGQGYVIDPEDRKHVEFVGGWYQSAMRVSDFLVLTTPVDFEAFGPEGVRWRSRRVSWDGMRNLHLKPGKYAISGEAWSPLDDDWIPFELDVRSGKVTGGSYNGPD